MLGPSGRGRCSSPHCCSALRTTWSSRPDGVSRYAKRDLAPGSRYGSRVMTPYSTRVASRSDRMSGATPSRSRNSANLVAPRKASRRIRKVQRSPTTPRARAIEHASSGFFAMLPSIPCWVGFLDPAMLGWKNLLRQGRCLTGTSQRKTSPTRTSPRDGPNEDEPDEDEPNGEDEPDGDFRKDCAGNGGQPRLRAAAGRAAARPGR